MGLGLLVVVVVVVVVLVVVMVVGEGLKMRAPTARCWGRSEGGKWLRYCALLRDRRRASGILGMVTFMVGGCGFELVRRVWLWLWRLGIVRGGLGFVVMVFGVWVMWSRLGDFWICIQRRGRRSVVGNIQHGW